jgi:hypothetical protein
MSIEKFKIHLSERSFLETLQEGARAARGATQLPDPERPYQSFVEMLQAGVEAARNAVEEDPWEPKLRRLKGRISHDGVERISTHDVFDILEVPMRRRPSETIRLSRVMRKLGWSSIRARGLNPCSYRDRVRGYAREVPGHPETIRRPNKF